jgi:steroid 5-alpha reductase family enzyme
MMNSPYLASLVALWLVAVILWASSLRSRNVNCVDVGWGMGFVIVAWLSYWIVGWNDSKGSSPQVSIFHQRSFWILTIVTLWGLRLSTYLAWRNWGKPEDHRYAAMRGYWGDRFAWRSLKTVFILQACLIWLISLCIQTGISGEGRVTLLTWLGVSVWLVGWLFETVGDWQMAVFKSDPGNKGRVMNRGLWRYTRHPNYFGDFLVWWGIYLVCLQPDSWWWTISGPLLMSFLLLRVSGVTLLEKSLSGRITEYTEYIRSTSSFVPWPPRRKSN